MSLSIRIPHLVFFHLSFTPVLDIVGEHSERFGVVSLVWRWFGSVIHEHARLVRILSLLRRRIGS